MAKRVQWIGHITTQADLFIGRARELTVDTTTNELRVHDGSTPGGHRVLNKIQNDLLYQPFGNSDFESITTDVIDEHSGNAGVTIDGVLVKDGEVDGVDISALETAVNLLISDLNTDEANLATHIANVSNPHVVTKTQVGLANVSNDAQLKIASNLSDLANAGTARTNLGLGGLATLSAIASAQITDDTIVNADINSAAAIALSKLAAQAAKTLLGNFTAGSAVPTAAVAGYGLDFTTNPAVSLQIAIIQDQKSAGTDGGTPVDDTWTKRTCDDTVVNTVSGLTIPSSVFTFATAGTYFVLYCAPFAAGGTVGGHQLRWRKTNGTPATKSVSSPAYQASSGTDALAMGFWAGAIAANDTFEVQYYTDVATATTGLGHGNVAASGEVAVFAQVIILRII